NENNPAGTHTYQWYRADNNTGLNRAAIAGATNSTYALVAADNGKFIQFEVTPVASAGTTPGMTTASNYSSAIASAIPATASLTFTITDNNIPNGKFHHFDNGFVNLFDGVTTYSSANSNDNKLHPTEYDNTSSFAQSNIKNNKNSPLMFRFANNQNTGTTLKVVWYNYDQGNNKTGFKRSRLIMELFNGNTLVQSAFSTVHADESESIARDFSVTATGTFNRVVIRTADDTKKHVMISEIEINNGNTTVAAGSISTD
ncbi:MAG: hypothetical protein N4A45_01515, partial [Flavobacteriales bacterium]|nr:hypothetical protein [Flavobacteriales bacterium]